MGVCGRLIIISLSIFLLIAFSGSASDPGLNRMTGQPPCAADAVDFSPADPTNLFHAGPLLNHGSYTFYYGKRTGNQIGQPDSWQAYGPVDLHGGKFYVFDIARGEMSEQDPKIVDPMIDRPGPTESLVWYRLSAQYSCVVCFEGPIAGGDEGEHPFSGIS